MCGIAGIRRFDGAAVEPAVINQMIALLEHRGPDDSRTWFGPGVGFGHRRLSIIDLDGSQQPMSSVGGRVTVTFNGEILNYCEVRGELDYPFGTNGDTEVVVATWATEGADGIRRLRGQFAFAAFDAGKGELALCRDRVGILPLYYAVRPGFVAFASEVKALAPALGPLEPDTASLDDYLAHRSVPAPFTMYQGVQKVMPGHIVRFTPRGEMRHEQYWSLPAADDVLVVRPDEAIDLVDANLKLAVEEALVADVPVGAYLSGGVDSSLLVAMVASLRGNAGLETFSAGFADSEVDELPYARMVSNELGTTHHEVRLSPDDFEADWRRLSWHRDAPLSEPADVAVFRLARTAREHVKVVLSGEGSDELFAGYPKYRAIRATEHLSRTPRAIRSLANKVGDWALPVSAVRPRILLRTIGGSTEYEQLRGWFAPFTERERASLLLGPARHSTRGELRGDPIRRLLEVDFRSWLPDNLLERGDRMSMATSLEMRPPFLDPRLVELAFRLPSDVKVRHRQTKWVLKQVALRYLPREIVFRPKVGFTVPLNKWLQGSFGGFARETLLAPGSFVREVFDKRVVASIVDDHLAGRSRDEIRVWTLLSLELWHQECVRPSNR